MSVPKYPSNKDNTPLGVCVITVVCVCALAYIAYLMYHNPSILATWDE